jgi:hypothetical protein
MSISVRELLAVLLIIVLINASCSSYRLVPPPYDAIKEGDKIKISTIDGVDYKLTVSRATADAIFGEGEGINISDISLIERWQFSLFKTSILVLGTWFLGLIGAASALASYPIGE